MTFTGSLRSPRSVFAVAVFASHLLTTSCAIGDGLLIADGIVLDARGQPVAGAVVITTGSAVFTDARGCFHLAETTYPSKRQMPFKVTTVKLKPFSGTIDSPNQVRVRVTLVDNESSDGGTVDSKPVAGALGPCEPASRPAALGSLPTPVAKTPAAPPARLWILELRAHIDRYAGPNATDCGQHLLRPGDVDEAILQRSVTCGIAEIAANRSFFTLKQDLASDSTIVQGLVGTPNGTIYRFSYSDGASGAMNEDPRDRLGSVAFTRCPSPGVGKADDVNAFVCMRKQEMREKRPRP